MTKSQIIERWNLLQRKLNPVNLTLLALSTLVLVGCDQQKAAINDKTDYTKDALDDQKRAVAEEAADATKRSELNATIEKANIEAAKVATQAQLDADKIKADAEAAAEKAKVAALRNQ